ncbi:MAG TPA: signal peptidase II [Candidatus Limnocylindria bacterium]
MTADAAMTRSRRGLLALGTSAVVIIALDQLTKALVVGGMAVGERIQVIGDLVILWHVQNRGAAFSLFQGATLLMYVVTVLAIGLVIHFHRAFAERGVWLQVLLGVITGGVLGNFVDRLRQGYVTDWLSMGIGDLRWPTYNVADASMFLGIGILVVYLTFFEGRHEGAGE